MSISQLRRWQGRDDVEITQQYTGLLISLRRGGGQSLLEPMVFEELYERDGWVADFTHVATFAGVVYVAFVVDTFSRRIVGWSAATSKETRLVLDALEMALWQRDRDQHPYQRGRLIHHSDAGSQYTSFALAEHLDRAGIAASIGSVGDAYDNSLMESTIGLFKTELIKPRRPWKTLSEVELATAEWVDWYCHRRLHGEIGHIPPVEYETNYYSETTKPQVTVKI
ncbi:IS3 family transposase [Streptomyces sp. NPDC056721]|uniref:IS3 family transposase n=1 Tax=Streptomyces sp. NPDC056721 TaxID=3345923 RepID=UPI0036BD0921